MEWNPLVAVGLGTSAVVATLGPLVLALVLWRRGASLKAWGVGALTFAVSQLVLRLPWQVPLNLWLAPKLKDDAGLLFAWLAFSALTAGLFEETGRWVAYRTLWKDRSTLGGVMLGAGHGGLESIVLVGLSLLSSTVVYVALTHGVTLGIPEAVLPKVHQQFAEVTPLVSFLGGVERVAAMLLHVGCSLLVLEGVRRADKRWLVGSMAVHTLLNVVGVALAKWVSPLAAEGALLTLGLAVLWLAARRSRG
ncbi:MAG: YhfC family intramembrane metalloprotease [Myxococcota bacterium]